MALEQVRREDHVFYPSVIGRRDYQQPAIAQHTVEFRQYPVDIANVVDDFAAENRVKAPVPMLQPTRRLERRNFKRGLGIDFTRP